jgi:hypothetical protein
MLCATISRYHFSALPLPELLHYSFVPFFAPLFALLFALSFCTIVQGV